MNNKSCRCVMVAVVGLILVQAAAFGQVVTIEDFDKWKPSGKPYDGWAAGEISAGPTSCVVRANNFGGVYTYLKSLDISKQDRIYLNAEVLEGNVGLVVVLEDGDGTVNIYSWYNLYPGKQELVSYLDSPAKVGNPGDVPGLDLEKLKGLHVQADDGVGTNNYAVVFQDLSASSGPITSPTADPPTD